MFPHVLEIIVYLWVIDSWTMKYDVELYLEQNKIACNYRKYWQFSNSSSICLNQQITFCFPIDWNFIYFSLITFIPSTNLLSNSTKTQLNKIKFLIQSFLYRRISSNISVPFRVFVKFPHDSITFNNSSILNYFSSVPTFGLFQIKLWNLPKNRWNFSRR